MYEEKRVKNISIIAGNTIFTFATFINAEKVKNDQ